MATQPLPARNGAAGGLTRTDPATDVRDPAHPDRGRFLLDEAHRHRWTVERLEQEYILDVLRHTGGHRGRAADILGIDRRTLYRKLKQYAQEGIGVVHG